MTKVLVERELLERVVHVMDECIGFSSTANELRAMLAQPAHDVASLPAGYVMVPVEPTPAMLDVAVSHALMVSLSGDYNWSAYMRDVWSRMLAASRLPVQPVQGMSNRSKRLDEIRAEAERFFEWPGDDRSTVTLTSCILFADHIASPSAPVVMPTEAELIAFAVEEQFFLFCDEDEFVQIAEAVLHKFARLNRSKT